MARKSPVAICEAKQRPRREPKFHQVEMLGGAGRSTNALLTVFKRGWVFRRLVIRVFIVEYNGGFSSRWSWFEPK